MVYYVHFKFQCKEQTNMVVFTPQKSTLYNCRQTFPVHLKSTERKIHNLSKMIRGENLHLAVEYKSNPNHELDMLVGKQCLHFVLNSLSLEKLTSTKNVSCQCTFVISTK